LVLSEAACKSRIHQSFCHRNTCHTFHISQASDNSRFRLLSFAKIETVRFNPDFVAYLQPIIKSGQGC
jgi:hypothetical protein